MRLPVPSWPVLVGALISLAGCQPKASLPGAPPIAPTPPASATASSAHAGASSPEAAALPRCRGDKPDETKPPTSGPRHTWEVISYPVLATPWGLDGKAHPSIGFGAKDSGLRFDLSFSAPGFRRGGGDLDKGATPKKGEVQVFLHTPHGKVLPKCGDDEIGGWVGGSLGASGSMMFIFPWQANELADAWIEVRLPATSYWLMVPYGFTRDPRDPLCPAAPSIERPPPPAVPSEPDRKVQVIPWTSVSYDLGLITPTWRLSLLQSNPFDASTTITLYKDDNSQGLLSWSLESPKTALRVERGYTVKGILMSITREEDGFRRTDHFRINRNPSSDGRFWGTLIVSVDGKDFPVLMPSSLFKYTHGSADLSAFEQAPP